MSNEVKRYNEWELFRELEKRGHKLRINPNDSRPVEELSEADIDWYLVGLTSAKNGFSLSLDSEYWYERKAPLSHQNT